MSMVRKRKRYSLQELLLFVTGVCLYCACWRITESFGVHDPLYSKLPTESHGDISVEITPGEMSPMPFLIYRREYSGQKGLYLWLFGPKMCLLNFR